MSHTAHTTHTAHTAHELRARLLKVKPYRDELGRIASGYRFSSLEYRRLGEAAASLDAAVEALNGDRELLGQPLMADWRPRAGTCSLGAARAGSRCQPR